MRFQDRQARLGTARVDEGRPTNKDQPDRSDDPAKHKQILIAVTGGHRDRATGGSRRQSDAGRNQLDHLPQRIVEPD